MKSLSRILLAIYIFVLFSLVDPRSILANNNNNDDNNDDKFTRFFDDCKKVVENIRHKDDEYDKDRDFCKKNPRHDKCKKDDRKKDHENDDQDDDDCREHPEKDECNPTIPEFGLVEGVIALISSGGTFFYLKKRSS